MCFCVCVCVRKRMGGGKLQAPATSTCQKVCVSAALGWLLPCCSSKYAISTTKDLTRLEALRVRVEDLQVYTPEQERRHCRRKPRGSGGGEGDVELVGVAWDREASSACDATRMRSVAWGREASSACDATRMRFTSTVASSSVRLRRGSRLSRTINWSCSRSEVGHLRHYCERQYSEIHAAFPILLGRARYR